MHSSAYAVVAPSELRCRPPDPGGRIPATTMEEGEKSTSETLHPCPDETGYDTPIAPVGPEAWRAATTPEATLSSTIAAGSPSVSESPPDSVASGNKEHDEPRGQHIDEVHPQEMIDSMVAARKEALHEAPREAWTTMVATLYATAHNSVTTDAERVPSGKQRFPKLRGDERNLLFKFFDEACIVGESSFAD